MLAVWILGGLVLYLVVGTLVIKFVSMIGADPPPDDILTFVVLAWPIVLVAFIGLAIWDSIKMFLKWDTSTWWAERKTARNLQRIERDLRKKE